MGADVTGVDAAQGLIDAASSHPAVGRDVHPRQRRRPPMEDDRFDLVLCNHLFSHLQDPAPPSASSGAC